VKKSVLSVLVSGSLAGLGFIGGGALVPAQACTDHAHATETYTPNYLVGNQAGGVYDNGGTPGSSTSGFIGVSGETAGSTGYIEAGGDALNPTSGGYIVTAGSSPAGSGGVEVHTDGSVTMC